MKISAFKNKYIWNSIVCLFTFFSYNLAFADNGIIQCSTTDKINYRVWKFESENGGIKIWTLNDDTFYQFCSAGFAVEFPSGLLCAFKKDKKIGTVATFIDIQKVEITDILIREDTVLNDPTTWKQKIKTTCESIRE